MKFYERVINDFGGYEKCKDILSQPNIDFIMNAQGLREHMLEYRRQHNIYEVGDSFVFNNGDNPEIMKVQHVWDDAVWGGYCGEIPKNTDIRHATDAEIAAGRRL